MSVEDLPFIEDALDWRERCADEEVDLFVVGKLTGTIYLFYQLSFRPVSTTIDMTVGLPST